MCQRKASRPVQSASALHYRSIHASQKSRYVTDEHHRQQELPKSDRLPVGIVIAIISES
jgi:hypothetical protein